MLNMVMLIGFLTRDPELKYSQSGVPICNFSVATNESYIDRDGKKIEKTEFHRIVTYQRQAETCGQYLAKGSKVLIIGKLQTRKWTDQQGQDRYTTEIIASRVQFLDRKGEGQQQPDRNSHQSESDDSTFPNGSSGMEDVPF